MHRLPPPRPLSLSIALILGTTAAGLAIRTLPTGLPSRIVKHGGSVLWALMIYWIVSTLRPTWTPHRSGIAAIGVTSVVELSQLYHLPSLDAFRQTSAGALLLGRVFSVWDLTTYAAAVLMGVAVDHNVRCRSTRAHAGHRCR